MKNEKEEQARMPVKIALLGMDERSIARVATIFKVVFKDRCVVSSVEEACLAIVDLDADGNVWDEFQHNYVDLPAIVLSESPSSAEGAIYVAKPAKLDMLWMAISRLVAGLSASDEIVTGDETIFGKKSGVVSENYPDDAQQNGSGAVELNVQEAENTPALNEGPFYAATDHSFDPDAYLLGHLCAQLKEMTGQHGTLHVRCWQERQLILLPDQGRAYTDLNKEQLRQLGRTPMDEASDIEITSICGTGSKETKSLWFRAYSRLLGKGELPTIGTDGLRAMPMDYLLWELTQYTACGRVPKGTNLSQAQFLQYWPNFTRLPYTENGMRIAALWVGLPSRLEDIAERLGIALAEVYEFYSAACVLGLAGPANRQVDGLVATHSLKNKGVIQKDLRNAILRHASTNR